MSVMSVYVCVYMYRSVWFLPEINTLAGILLRDLSIQDTQTQIACRHFNPESPKYSYTMTIRTLRLNIAERPYRIWFLAPKTL